MRDARASQPGARGEYNGAEAEAEKAVATARAKAKRGMGNFIVKSL